MSLLFGQSLSVNNCLPGTYYSVLRGNRCVPFFSEVSTPGTVVETEAEPISPVQPTTVDSNIATIQQGRKKKNTVLYVMIALVALYIVLVLYRNYKAGTLPKLKLNKGEQKIKTYGFAIV